MRIKEIRNVVKRLAKPIWVWSAVAVLAAALSWAYLPASFFGKNKLQVVEDAGKLTVLTINGPTTYYQGPAGPQGFEYDLAKAFAEHLGVALEIIVEDNFSEVIPRVANGEVDFAASGITVTELRKRRVRFSPSYQEIRQQVVFRRGNERPSKVKHLIGRDLAVLAGTSYVERLAELKRDYPDLEWEEFDDMGIDELLIEVWEGLVELTIADSNLIAIVRQFYPEIHIAFSIQKPEQLAWAFPLGKDRSLYDAAATFLKEMDRSGGLAGLRDRYYGPASRSNYLDVTTYQRRIESDLPLYQELFEQAAKETGIDWRLLAAQAYQESHWNVKAVSPTGVRGIMMLTLDTARQVSVQDRRDPAESIRGGALYMSQLYARTAPDVKEPDRTWMALAAYNVGLGHLEDARIITQKQGGDPNKWADVKDRLPLLAKPSWYKKTKYGYARGYEPVQYVTRIRTFYDILVKIDEEEKQTTKIDALKVEAPAL